MNKFSKKIGKIFLGFCFSLISCLLFLPTASAAGKWSDIKLPGDGGSIADGDFIGFLTIVTNWLLGLGGALAVLAIIYSGIIYLTAGADETKAASARKNLTWAITGVIVVLLSFVIVRLIHQALS